MGGPGSAGPGAGGHNGPCGNTVGMPLGATVDNYNEMTGRHSATVPTTAVRVNLLNWNGGGVPTGMFPPVAPAGSPLPVRLGMSTGTRLPGALGARMNCGFRAPKTASRAITAVPLTPEQCVIAHMAASILLDYPTPKRRAQFSLVEASVWICPAAAPQIEAHFTATSDLKRKCCPYLPTLRLAIPAAAAWRSCDSSRPTGGRLAG
ncbi:hypothetical protein IWX77_001839 [Cryobacterium sp. CAN_C2]